MEITGPGDRVYVCVGGNDDGYITKMEKAKCFLHLAGEQKTNKTECRVLGFFGSLPMFGWVGDFCINIPLILWKMVIFKISSKQRAWLEIIVHKIFNSSEEILIKTIIPWHFLLTELENKTKQDRQCFVQAGLWRNYFPHILVMCEQIGKTFKNFSVCFTEEKYFYYLFSYNVPGV